MLKGTYLSIKKNKLLIFIFLISIISIIGLVLLPCPVKYFIGLSCPGCGLRRSFMALFKFDLLKSLYYNIMTIPLSILFIFMVYCLVKDKSFNKVLTLLDKYYVFIIIMIIVSEAHNILLRI